MDWLADRPLEKADVARIQTLLGPMLGPGNVIVQAFPVEPGTTGRVIDRRKASGHREYHDWAVAIEKKLRQAGYEATVKIPQHSSWPDVEVRYLTTEEWRRRKSRR